MKPFRFGLVGCGRICSKHLEALSAIEDCQLVAVSDVREERARDAVAEQDGVAVYGSYHEMLQNEEIDVVSVLTPSGLHAEHVVDIVSRYQKHIVCEKPMALRLDDADEMIRVCDEHGVKLFVVKQNRYNVPVQELRQALEAGRFGRLVMGTVRVRWSRPQRYYDQDDWRGTWRYDGGVLTNQASHHIDLLEWMLGQPVSVMSMTRTALADIEVEDTGVAIVRFASGALGVIEATTATRPNDLEGSLSILGEHGTVVIGGFAVNRMETWQFDDADEDEHRRVMDTASENPPNVYGFGHRRYLEEVVETLRSDRKALVDGMEGRKSLELINAIYESAETGREVTLRYTPSQSPLGVGRG